jgi:hypothetical protein
MQFLTRAVAGAGLGVMLIGCGSSPTVTTTPTSTGTADHAPGALDTLVFTSDIYAATPNNLREVYSLNSNTPGTPTRLTFSNTAAPASNLEAAPAPDRTSVAVRRVTADTNGDGLLNDSDNAEFVFIDLLGNSETVYAPSSAVVTGIDYAITGTDIAYSAAGSGGLSDLFDLSTSAVTAPTDITNTPTISERRPRFDATGSVVAFEFITSGHPNSIYLFDTSGNEDPVDIGTAGGTPLPGTPYVVGGDADPAFAPGGSQIVFRRLTGIPNAQGSWDLIITTGTSTTTLATGPLYRGAPDWGANGILYVETDPTLGTSSIITVAPDGSGRKVLYTAPAGYTIANPRWLP